MHDNPKRIRKAGTQEGKIETLSLSYFLATASLRPGFPIKISHPSSSA
jgi:hypothetical protein